MELSPAAEKVSPLQMGLLPEEASVGPVDVLNEFCSGYELAAMRSGIAGTSSYAEKSGWLSARSEYGGVWKTPSPSP